MILPIVSFPPTPITHTHLPLPERFQRLLCGLRALQRRLCEFAFTRELQRVPSCLYKTREMPRRYHNGYNKAKWEV